MRILLRILGVLGLLVIVLTLGVFYYLNSGQYRSLLERAVAENSDYELTVAGDVDLNLFPTPSLSLNDVRLVNPTATQELFSSSSVALSLDARELLAGRLLIKELLAQDLHVNYFVRADGSSIWDTTNPVAADSGASSAAGASVQQIETSTGEIIALEFERISIRNARIDYQDLSRGLRYEIDNFNLQSQNTNFEGRPFDFAIDFDFENNGMSAPVPVALRSNMIIDPGNAALNLSNTQLSITPLLIQGNIAVANFNRGMQYTGSLHADPFDVVGLTQTLALTEAANAAPESGIGERPRLGLSLEFSGNQTEATVPDLTLTLNDDEINGSGSVRFATDLFPTSVSYELLGGDLDLTGLLPATPTGEAQAPSSQQPQAKMPFELLSAFNLLGSASLASVTLGELIFEDINVFTNIEDGVLDIEIAPVSALGGNLQGSVRVNAQAETPELETSFAMNQLNLADLAAVMTQVSGSSGRFNLESTYRASARTLGTMGASLAGSTTFSIDNSSIDISLIKQIFTAIAAFSPTGESIQQWPDVVQFSELYGTITLEEGLQANQDIVLRMDNFDITGSGGINLQAGSFDYDLLFTVLGEPFTQTIPIIDRYHDVPWPVRCNAEFDAAPSQYCSPDFGAVRDVFTDLSSQAAQDRFDEAIDAEAPENPRNIPN